MHVSACMLQACTSPSVALQVFWKQFAIDFDNIPLPDGPEKPSRMWNVETTSWWCTARCPVLLGLALQAPYCAAHSGSAAELSRAQWDATL